MEIIRHNTFKKQYKKLSEKNQEAVHDALKKFEKNPLDKSLRNHALKGKKYAGLRSIDARFDLRIIFLQKENYTIVILLYLGSHSQLYG